MQNCWMDGSDIEEKNETWEVAKCEMNEWVVSKVWKSKIRGKTRKERKKTVVVSKLFGSGR